MSTGIYVILNLSNNKFYIGSSINIEGRWNNHKIELRNNKHINPKLQNAWNKYGEDSFLFKIIHECKPDELLIKEQMFMDEHQVCERGYNINPCAQNRLGAVVGPLTPEHKEKLRITSTKMWESQEFREKMVEERRARAQTPKGRQQLLDANKKSAQACAKTYEIISPDGVKYLVHNLSAFCREHGLKRQSMGDVVKGRVPQCYGWTGRETPEND